MKKTQKLIVDIVVGLFVALVLGYLAARLLHNYFEQLQGASSVNRFLRYLLGLLLELLLVWALAFVNYRLVFLRFFIDNKKPLRSLYWAWLSFAGLLLFFILEWLTLFEPEFADENVWIVLVLVIFIVSYSYIADYFRTRRLQLQLLKEKSEAELNILKAQIKPHFLFNTLNTIFNAALKNEDEETASLISELSGLLRFSIQEAQLDFTRIENELSFLEQYIHLQKARLPQLPGIDIQTHIEWDHQMAQIPPLLLIPFVENAFQYSISMEKPCFLHLNLAVKNQFLEMQLVNSIAPHANRKKGMGTGINNAKARLQLLYPGRHQLDIQAQEAQYSVHLSIQLTHP
jgi:hypothetical protein